MYNVVKTGVFILLYFLLSVNGRSYTFCIKLVAYLSSRSNQALVVVLTLMSISLGSLSITSLYRDAPPMMTASFAGNSAFTDSSPPSWILKHPSSLADLLTWTSTSAVRARSVTSWNVVNSSSGWMIHSSGAGGYLIFLKEREKN